MGGASNPGQNRPSRFPGELISLRIVRYAVLIAVFSAGNPGVSRRAENWVGSISVDGALRTIAGYEVTNVFRGGGGRRGGGRRLKFATGPDVLEAPT